METIPPGDDSKGIEPELATAVYAEDADHHRERAGIADRAQVGTMPSGLAQEPHQWPPLRILSTEAQTINREPRRRGLPPSPPSNFLPRSCLSPVKFLPIPARLGAIWY